MESLKLFSDAIIQQFKSHDLSPEQFRPLEESIGSLVTMVENIKEPERINEIERNDLRTKFADIILKMKQLLPKPEILSAFELLESFDKLIGVGVSELAEDTIQKQVAIEADQSAVQDKGPIILAPETKNVYATQAIGLIADNLAAGQGKIMLASSQDQFSMEKRNYVHSENDKPHSHGVLSFHLIEGLGGKAAYHDTGVITMESLVEYVKEQMKFEGRQQPIYSVTEASNLDKIKIAATKQQKNQEIQGKREGIIIGTNTFVSESIPPLAGAENDAREIFGQLVKNGNFNISSNHFLIGPDATRKNILKAISDIFRKSMDFDLVIFYYSGHGVIDSDGEGYIVPYDMDFEDPFVSGINIKQLKDFIYESKYIGTIIIVFDCVFSGIAAQGTK